MNYLRKKNTVQQNSLNIYLKVIQTELSFKLHYIQFNIFDLNSGENFQHINNKLNKNKIFLFYKKKGTHSPKTRNFQITTFYSIFQTQFLQIRNKPY